MRLKDLATETGMSRPTISRHFNGKRSPNIQQRRLYATALEIPKAEIDELFSEDGLDVDDEAPSLPTPMASRMPGEFRDVVVAIPANVYSRLVIKHETMEKLAEWLTSVAVKEANRKK